MDEDGLRDLCQKLHIPADNTMGKGKLIDELFGATANTVLSSQLLSSTIRWK